MDGGEQSPKNETIDPSEPGSVSAADRPIFAWGSIAVCLVAPAIGVLLAAVLLITVILPRLGHGPADRSIAIATSLDRADFRDRPTAIFLGSSVVVEGIDAAAVEAAAPGWGARNFAINGAEINEQRIMLPRLLAAGPRAVVLMVRPITLAQPAQVHADKAYGYAIAGFPEAWPDGYRDPERRPLVADDTLVELDADPLEAKLHYRRVPITAVNDAVRVRLRGGVRAVAPDEFVAPYNLTEPVGGATLDRHVRTIIEDNERRLAAPVEPLGRELALACEQIAAAGAIPVLFVAPQHPRVAPAIETWTDEVAALAERLAREHGGIFEDARHLVGADGFADALHLGESGRDQLSRAVGARLATIGLGGTGG